MNWLALIWFILMVVFILAEISTVALVSTWFGVGALAAMITALLGGQLWLQTVVFLVVSAIMLALLRPMAKKYFQPKLIKTNVDAVIGSEGIVSEQIDNLSAGGRVKLAAMEWSARSTTGETIAPGTVVRVDRVEGVKVFVTAVSVPAAK